MLYTDFFLPSSDELQLMNSQLYMYSVGGFSAAAYWSSSEQIIAPYLNAYEIDFNTNTLIAQPKGNSYRVRACHTFNAETGSFAIRDKGICGGLIFWIVNLGGGQSKYYEAAPSDTSASYVWSNVVLGGDITYTGIGYGKPNSDAIIAQVGHTTSAANDCENLSISGRTLLYPPTNLSYTYTSGATFFTLFWQNNNGSGVVSNVIQYSNNGGSTWNIYGSVLSGATQLQCFIAAPNSRLWRVSAVDGDGYYWSSTGIEVYCLINPTAVSVYQSFCNHVNVQWTNNNSHWVYRNEVQIFTGGVWTNYTYTLSGTTNSAVFFAPSTAMPIRVGVVAPDGYTQWSTAVTGTTLTVSNPQSLTAIMEGTSVRLNWTNVTTIGDGIHVWRDGTDLGTLSVSATTFLDSTAIGGNTYSYSVAATCGIYSYYSNSAVITTTVPYVAHNQQVSDIFIQFNDQALYDVVLEDFEVNYQLADLKNLSQAKTSFTIPVRIPYTPHSRAVFGSLFNVNSQSTITNIKVNCKLYYHDKVVIDGFSYVYFSTPDYINIIIARNDISIFEDVGDRTLDKLQFTGSSYTYHNYNQEIIISYGGNFDINNFNNCPWTGNTTYDHDFVMINWWNAGSLVPANSQYNNLMFANGLFQNYPLSPVVRVKTIFDRIFSDNGYTYTASTSFMDKLDKLYMTTTVPITNYTQDVKSNYLFSGTTVYGASTAKNIYRIDTNGYWCIGFSNFDNYTGNTSMGNIITSKSLNAENSLFYKFPFFAGQECTVTLGLYGVPDSGPSGSTNIEIHSCTFNANFTALQSIDDAIITFPTVVFDTSGNTAKYYEVSTTFTPPANFDSTRWFMVTINQDNATSLSRTKQAGYKEAGITVTTPNYLYYTGTTYTLQDLLPNNYTQFDFLNNLLTATNIYIYADVDNNKLLHLEDSKDFNTQQVLDWSKKFTLDNFEIYDTSQQIYNQYTLGTKDSDDAISKSYLSYNNITLNEKVLNNTNQLAINEPQDIRLTQPQGVLTYGLTTTNSNIYNNSIPLKTQQPIFTYYDKQNSACLFGYINKFITVAPNGYNLLRDQFLTVFVFGGFGVNGEFTDEYGNWYAYFLNIAYSSFSPFKLTGNTRVGPYPFNEGYPNINLQELSNPNTFAWLFDTNDTYLNLITGNTITNNNLYSNFWQNDMESKLYSNQKFVKSYIRLRENDLPITNFKKKFS